MNTFKTILLGLGMFAGLAMTSCNLETVSQSTYDESQVFADPTLTTYQIYSIYEVYGLQNSHRGRYLPYYGYNTDIEYVNSNDPTNEKQMINRFNCLPTNAQLNATNTSGSGNPYESLFVGVERANLAIRGIRQYGNIENNAQMAALLGEALVARAMLYLELMKAYGEVPARFEPVASETIYLNKSDKDVIFKQILADLEESFEYLTYSTNVRSDRVGLAFAKGLYARIGLIASGYSLRPDEGTVGTGNAGTVRLSNDPDLQKSVLYPKILEALKDVIANSGLSLEANFETIWKSMNNMENTVFGPEVMFIIPFSDTRGRWNYSFAVRYEGYYPPYNNVNGSRGGQASVVPYVYYWYDEEDVRRDLSCVNYKWDPEQDSTYPVPAGFANWYFGKYRMEWMFAKPYSTDNDDGVKPIYMRYADILLMAAEVANSTYCGARDENYAKECLKTVMYRAYANNTGKADNEINSISGESAIFEYIQKQRALEFVGEFLRMEDLIRWNCLKEKLDNAAYELASLREGKVGAITGVDYGRLFNPDNASETSGPRQYAWYRKTTDADGLPCIYIYGIHLDETESDSTTPPPGDYDWQQILDSSGSPTSYITSSTFTSSGSNYDLDRAKTGVAAGSSYYGFYNLDPETHMWWPIPEVMITNGQGYLVNDYPQIVNGTN